jgi:hypothetical protein
MTGRDPNSYEIADKASDHLANTWFLQFPNIVSISPLLFQTSPTIKIGVEDSLISELPKTVPLGKYSVKILQEVVRDVKTTCDTKRPVISSQNPVKQGPLPNTPEWDSLHDKYSSLDTVRDPKE